MYNLNGSVLRVVTRLENLYTYDVEVEKVEPQNSGLTQNKNSTFILKGGFAVRILQELSLFLNFSFEILPDPSLAFKFEQASNLSIDLFAASYSILPKRAALVDPTFVIGASRVRIFLDHRFEVGLNDYVLLPFDIWVWISIIFVIIFASLFFALCSVSLEGIEMDDGIFLSVAVFLQKGLSLNDKYGQITITETPTRITLLIASVFTIILVASYSGAIVSIASVQRFSVTDYEKLTDSDYDVSFDFGFNNGSAIQSIVESLVTGNPIMQKLYTKISKSKFVFESFEDSIERIHKRPFAYIIDEETGVGSLQKVIGFFPCSFGSHSFAGVKYPWSMFTRKSSEYRAAINYGILKLTEVGLIRNFARRFIPRQEGDAGCSEFQSPDGNFKRIQLKQIQTAFVLLFLGFIISFIFLIIETRKIWRGRIFHFQMPKTNIKLNKNKPKFTF